MGTNIMIRQRSRVILVYPPSRTQNHASCPVGLLMLAAVLEHHGYEIHLLDACAAGNQQNADQIVEKIRLLNPDVVGITLVTPLVRTAYELAGLEHDDPDRLH